MGADCCGLPYFSIPNPWIPTERGFRTRCRSSCSTGGCSSQQRTHSSAGCGAARAPKPSMATDRSSSERRHGGKASAQALPPRAASAKDLTEIRLELHQVSALSPQLQAGMSFTLPDSLLQART